MGGTGKEKRTTANYPIGGIKRGVRFIRSQNRRYGD